MAEFEVPIVRITKVENHPNADRLSLIYFRGFAVVSAKLDDGSHRYKVGDLVAYCPQDSVIPDYLLKQGYYQYDIVFDLESSEFKQWGSEIPVTNQEGDPPLDLRSIDASIPDQEGVTNGIAWKVLNTGKGLLGGSKGNRVKPVKLRNVLSEGIMFPVTTIPAYGLEIFTIENETEGKLVEEGDNVANFLGITKYEPVLPEVMGGDVCYVGPSNILQFDIENIKKFPDVIQSDEEIVVTEKLHGTFFGMGFNPEINHPDLLERNLFCFSKGLAKQGVVFKNNSNNDNNMYVKNFQKHLWLLRKLAATQNTPVYVFGEIFGKGVQDLHYGVKEPSFRVFKIFMNGSYVDYETFLALAHTSDFRTVPVLFKGKFKDYDVALKTGNSTLAQHVREGVVIETAIPRKDDIIGHVILKDINEKYLTRKNGTEYN